MVSVKGLPSRGSLFFLLAVAPVASGRLLQKDPCLTGPSSSCSIKDKKMEHLGGLHPKAKRSSYFLSRDLPEVVSEVECGPVLSWASVSPK